MRSRRGVSAIRFLATLLALNGEAERALTGGGGIVNPAGEEQRLGQPRRPQGLGPHHRQSLGVLHALLEERQAFGESTPERVGVAQVRGGGEYLESQVARSAQTDSLLQHLGR